MLAFAWACRWRPLPRDVRARSVAAVTAVRGNASIASCSTSKHICIRSSHRPLTAASTTAIAHRPQRHLCTSSASPCRTTSVSQQGSSFSSRESQRIRRISLWSGREQGARSWGAGSRSSEYEGDLSRLRRQGQEEEVLATLSGVIEPCTGKGVVELGLVQDILVDVTASNGSHGPETDGQTGAGADADADKPHDAAAVVTFALRLPTLALPGGADLASRCEAAVLALPWVASAAAATKARRPRWRRALPRQAPRTSLRLHGGDATGAGAGGGVGGGGGGGAAPSPGLESVRDVVCVSSCKGGVGKSTVAVNLAYSLAARGAKVGLLDADVYGPSLPTLVKPDDVALRVSPAFPDLKLLSPVVHRGVACMSFGWVNAKAGVPGAGGHGAAVMRGPMVSKVINQLLLGTDWGELEYLIIDMPPGTGDIQITLGQALQMSGAVVVTTPQKLSYVDVVKGIDMFAEIKVPVLSVVENMAYFDCGNGERHRPFGPGHVRQLVDDCGLAPGCVFSLPLSPAVARGSDCGDPVSLSHPEGDEAKVYQSLADAVVREAYRAGETTADAPQVLFKPTRGIVLRYISEAEAVEFVIPPFELRTRDPATGEPLSGEQAAAVSEDVKPISVGVRGNYAVSISWSDGHRGAIYSYQVLRKIAEQQQQQQQ